MEAKTFYIPVNPPKSVPIAIADITLILYSTYYHGLAGINEDLPLYYVNRVSVPEGYRWRGYGSLLLQKILTYADEHHLHLILDAVPSGEEMGLDDLISWYKRHEFRPLNNPQTLLYLPPLTEVVTSADNNLTSVDKN